MARPTDAERNRKARELSEKQLAYVIWQATPEGLRKPDTAEEFADAIGVSRQSLWRWRKDPIVLDAVRFVVIQNAGDPSSVVEVLQVLKDAATDNAAALGNRLKAAETWLRATGVMSSFTRGNSVLDALDNSPEGFADFSDEQLELLRVQAEANASELAAIQNARTKLAVVSEAAV